MEFLWVRCLDHGKFGFGFLDPSLAFRGYGSSGLSCAGGLDGQSGPGESAGGKVADVY